MKQYFDNFRDDFLLPSESNFEDLLSKIGFLHNKVIDASRENVPRIPLANRYSYDTTAHSIPLKSKSSSGVLIELAAAFQGSIRWNQPTSLVNITPNPLLDSVAAASIAALYNTNAFWDYCSGNVTLFEKDVVQFLSHLAGWDQKRVAGLSTSGGKATLMYAIKCGLNICDRGAVTKGLQAKYVVIAGKTSHYSIEDNCNYLGIGRENVLRVDVDQTGAMIPSSFEETLRKALIQKKKVAAIITLGGDTLEHTIDPVKEIFDIRTRLVQEFALDYSPLLHLDSVNAWVGMAFREYDFGTNPLGIDTDVLEKIHTLSTRIREVQWADSFGADFHKTGLAPYVSSFFVIKQGMQLHSINKDVLLEERPAYRYGEVHTHHISFENSRSASGILGAWVSIQRLGVEGYQRYWAQLMTVGSYIRHAIRTKYNDEIRVLNTTALGHPNVIQLVPPDFTATYEELLVNDAAREKYSEYCFGLYDYMAYELLKSNQPYTLLGFVPSYKYEQTGVKRPAFLAYLNHPHVDEKTCDTLLQQIITMKHTFEAQRNSARAKTIKHFKHLPK